MNRVQTSFGPATSINVAAPSTTAGICQYQQEEKGCMAAYAGWRQSEEAVLEQKDVVAPTGFGRLPKMRLKSEQPGLLVRNVLGEESLGVK
jgi:hypothetical protein